MKKLSIVFLANSFGDDTVEYMPKIAKDLGYDLDLYNLYIGGCPVESHINNILTNAKAYELRVYNKEKEVWETEYNVSSKEFISSRKWDFFITQQASHRSGVVDGLEKVNELIDLVKGLLVDKSTKIGWNMTWSYPSFSRLEVFGNDFGFDQDAMYKGILTNVQKVIVGNSNFSFIIPNGIAVKNARVYLRDELLHRDDLHLSLEFGRYLAGLTAIAVLLNDDLEEVLYHPEKVPAEIRDLFKRCALDAIDEINKIN